MNTFKRPLRGAFHLSDAELQIVLECTTKHRDRAILELMAYCGLRRSEICGLQAERVDLHAGEIEIIGKGRKRRTVPLTLPLSARLRDIIGRQKTGFVFGHPGRNRFTRPMSARGVAEIVKRAGIRTGFHQRAPGLKNLNPHALRHTFARRMKDRGMDWNDLAMLMGHSDPKLTISLYGTHSFEQVKKIFLDIVRSQ